MSDEKLQVTPGLAGIAAAESAVSWIDGLAGILEYRGIPIEELAAGSTFEETAYLLIHGALPTKAQLDAYRRRLASRRELPGAFFDVIRALPSGTHPMAALQASLAVLGTFDAREDFKEEAAKDEACDRILEATATIIAAHDRNRRGADPIAPDPSLGTAANFLYMLKGERPAREDARVLDIALILHADHTMNASTFTARVVASTEADPYAVVSSACGSLKGPLHGGANERVLDMLEEIGSGDVGTWIDARLEAGRKVMGFGHRVYKVKDPRAIILQGLARDLFERHGSSPVYETALRLEEEMKKRVGAKGIYPNVDFFSGIVYAMLGIPTDLFTPIFAISRAAGWLAHWREQMVQNRIFRPTQAYVGKRQQQYVPVEKRG